MSVVPEKAVTTESGGVPQEATDGGQQRMPFGGRMGQGWYETRQALARDLTVEDVKRDPHRCCGAFPLRNGMFAYLLFLVATSCVELAFAVLFLNGQVKSLGDVVNESAGTPEEKQALQQLVDQQRPWVTVQLAWACISLLFALVGVPTFYTENRKMLRVWQVWLYAHIFFYFATSVIFMQLSPLAEVIPGYIVISLLVALVNIYAGYCMRYYMQKLQNVDEFESRRAGNRMSANSIGAPV